MALSPARSDKRDRRAYWATRRASLKRRCFEAYGAQCQHCGEDDPDVLALDHVHDDGHLDKKPGGQRRAGSETYRRVARAGYPQDRYQLLCCNCNFRKELRRRRAKQEPSTGPADGSRGTRPRFRAPSWRATERSKGIQPGGRRQRPAPRSDEA